MRKELLEGLTEEQIKRIKDCKNPDEIIALAKEEGIELTDEHLEVINGGSACITTPTSCPKCGTSDITTDYGAGIGYLCVCNQCGHKWKNLIG